MDKASPAMTETKPLILLVDDDLEILGLLHEFLEAHHYETRMATSAAMALAMLEETTRMPDLALLDIIMPGMNGLDLAAALKATSTVPFMFLSADDGSDTARRAAECGAVGFLVKPLQLSQILPGVVAALARAEEFKTLRQQEMKLIGALRSGRQSAIAIGILMERFGLNQASAFEMLRELSRSRRTKLSAVALSLIEQAEAKVTDAV
ncbi:MAG: response regulator [Pseudomonadota bacterium]